MFTISCYTFHPFIHRFVRIWKHVQVLSNIVVFILSILCCQCKPPGSLTFSEFDDESSNEINIERGRVSKERRTDQVTVDLTPNHGDSIDIQAKCAQYWDHIDSMNKLDEIKPAKKVSDSQKLKLVPVHKKRVPDRMPESSSTEGNYTSIVITENMHPRGAVKAAFGDTAFDKCLL